MRHNRDEKRFDMTWSHLRSVLANMASDLVMHGRIKTTTPRAKVLRRYAERMITLGKDGGLAARRRAMSFLRSKGAVTKLFAELAPRFKDRNGGYTRILRLGTRPGDNAKMSLIEFVGAEPTPAAAAKPAKQKAKKAAAVKEKPASKKKAAAKPSAAAKKAAETKAAPKKENKEAKTGK